MKQISQFRSQFTNCSKRVERHEAHVRVLEDELNLDERWTAEHAEYQTITSEIELQSYRKALDNLERVVVQRLFELTKLGMSGIGK
jgi:hypothetical protein